MQGNYMASSTKKAGRVKTTRRRLSFRIDANRLGEKINHWSRPLRITTATGVSVLWVGFLIGIFNLVLPSDVFSDPDSALKLVVGVTIFGFALYGIGWALLVGFDLNSENEWHAGRFAAYYVMSGWLVTALTVIGVIIGILYAFVL